MKFNFNWEVKNNELIKKYFFSKFKFDWILDNLHLKEMEALSETVYCKMHNGDRQKEKKIPLLSFHLQWRQPCHNCCLLRFPDQSALVQFQAFNSHPYFILGVELSLGAIDISFWFQLKIATSRKSQQADDSNI